MLSFFTFELGEFLSSGLLSDFLALTSIACVIYVVSLIFSRRDF